MIDRAHRKIIDGWRAQYAELLKAHAAAVAGNDKSAAGNIRRQMRDLERAIKRLSETRQGEFRRAD